MKQLRKPIALLLSAALICSCALTMGATAPREEWVFVPGYIDDGFEAPVSYREQSQQFSPGNVGSATLPSSFDLRNVNGVSYMTSVKNQGSYGTCWAHAALSSVESNLLMRGEDSYDLSELQAVYYSYNRNEAVAAGGGDYSYYDPSAVNVLMKGGNPIFIANSMASQIGLIPESELRYSAASRFTTTSAATLKTALENEYARSKNVVTLENYYNMAPKNTDAIKRQLIEGGAGTLSYASSKGTLAADDVSYYCSKEVPSDHAVSLCGWDDDYPASKFNDDGNVPQNNGAWLCKNSWDVWFGDEGYFWISYEDLSISEIMFLTGKPMPEEYDNLYQHDGGVSTMYRYIPVEGVGSVFTADGDEALQAVRFQLLDSDVTATVKVYTGVSGAPTSGELKASQTVECSFAGIYTVDLETPVLLNKGTKFSVIVEMKPDGGGGAHQIFDFSYTSNGVTNVAVDASGQSYYLSGSSWVDAASSYGNFRVKAIASDEEFFTPTGVTGDVNADGKLTIADAVLIMGHLLNDTMTGTRLQVADANGDLDVDEADVIWITRTLVDLTP